MNTDYEKMIRVSHNEWETNSDISGYTIKLIDGYYEVSSFDECWEENVFEEKDTNLAYLQNKYSFGKLDLQTNEDIKD